jgi:hypothetical protein
MTAAADQRRSVLAEARRTYSTMARVAPGEWDWSRCLRFAHAAALGRRALVHNQMQAIAAAIEAMQPGFVPYGRQGNTST